MDFEGAINQPSFCYLATIAEPHGTFRDLFLTEEELNEYLRDCDGYAAKQFSLSKEDYRKAVLRYRWLAGMD